MDYGKGFAQRLGTRVQPTQLTLAFLSDDLLGLEEQINKYVNQMYVEIDKITMLSHVYNGDMGGTFCALVVFKDQEE